ncbi:uncharacterized protein N7482_002141 [Penicillium canariense]|uniref:Uncharacterized protein n=1 Tax=Penicillium canariense TaxID=189055 RepID=A0A9W9IH99_9EURO|nr:uncharacterized protein N7482_002141 [Penicillium canariense]KAJ5176264.1 hypothetical protein N7482_002141 [Penicillium canariense]
MYIREDKRFRLTEFGQTQASTIGRVHCTAWEELSNSEGGGKRDDQSSHSKGSKETAATRFQSLLDPQKSIRVASPIPIPDRADRQSRWIVWFCPFNGV